MVLTVVLLLIVLGVGALALRGAGERHGLELELADLRARARVEGTTKLGNHQAFAEDLEREILRADRTGRPATLVVLSLQSAPLRAWSESGAHETAAEVIRGELRGVDVGYRIGTEEFAMILPETRARGALVAAGRIEQRLLAVGVAVAGVTVGIAELGPGIDRHQLFRNAYCALLAAGREGRASLLIYSPDLEQTGAGGSPERASVEAVDGPAT